MYRPKPHRGIGAQGVFGDSPRIFKVISLVKGYPKIHNTWVVMVIYLAYKHLNIKPSYEGQGGQG